MFGGSDGGMWENKMQVNPEKTEVLRFPSSCICKLEDGLFWMGLHALKNQVHSLGVLLDPLVSLEA